MTVYEKNYAGIRFYERHGFKKIGIKHFPLGKQDRICPILEKEILKNVLTFDAEDVFLDW